MTSKKNKDRFEVLVGSRLGCPDLHVVIYLDGERFIMSAKRAEKFRKKLKKTIRYIRKRS